MACADARPTDTGRARAARAPASAGRSEAGCDAGAVNADRPGASAADSGSPTGSRIQTGDRADGITRGPSACRNGASTATGSHRETRAYAYRAVTGGERASSAYRAADNSRRTTGGTCSTCNAAAGTAACDDRGHTSGDRTANDSDGTAADSAGTAAAGRRDSARRASTGHQ